MNINSLRGEPNSVVSPQKPTQSSKDKGIVVQDTEKPKEVFDITAITKKINEALKTPSALSVINKVKVDAISKELGAGTYSIDPVRLAEKIIDFEIGTLEKK